MKFEIGQTYWTTSIADADCVFEFTIVSRTAKFITFTMRNDNRQHRVGVTCYDGTEYAMPFGRYSMAPQISAERRWEVAA